ncbi:hypothetical protein E2N92_11945 [Methanofollis formosanus]|uniref:Right-handed parallel beta-helix repeat-containing protein n=1 Tax=Methanofollis formosanus TaxID=299308 RepID=A0A8G1EHJ8_9EURY|nr:NosD domain-containing protein [Methanofollis formosanus]QYZ80087.1 hypothetical protein E2N92_11945 [Methanofollis formosanus]
MKKIPPFRKKIPLLVLLLVIALTCLVLAVSGIPVYHGRVWHVSYIEGGENRTSLHDISRIGAGDIIHIWGAEGHPYEGGITIDVPGVTIRRWGGSPAQPLITCTSHAAPAFTLTGAADDTVLYDLEISGNLLERDRTQGAAVNAFGTAEDHLQGLIITDCTFTGNAANGNPTRGGALSARYVDDLRITESTFTDNHAVWGGGAYCYECEGVTITDTGFTRNTADGDGGGARFDSCRDVALTSIAFTANHAKRGGGTSFEKCSGVTLTDATFSDNRADGDFGGGAHFHASSGTSIADATFSGNHADEGFGGGVSFVTSSGATITDTAFTGNSAKAGGGVCFSDSDDLALTGTAFTENNADRFGGGVSFITSSDATITDTVFTGNSAKAGGGACFSGSNDLALTGTTFSENNADRYGGGAFVDMCRRTTLTGTTLADNSAETGSGTFFQLCEDSTLTDTVFTDNTATNLGGGTCFWECQGATLTGTVFTGNTAIGGGGAHISSCERAIITNCRFDNPTNIYAEDSAGAVLNTPRHGGRNIAGGSFLGGNLWLRDPAQNISEWAADADGDGICDEPLNIEGFGTDSLPLTCRSEPAPTMVATTVSSTEPAGARPLSSRDDPTTTTTTAAPSAGSSGESTAAPVNTTATPVAEMTAVMTAAAPAETPVTLTTAATATDTTPAETQTPFPTAMLVVAWAIAAMAIRRRE